MNTVFSRTDDRLGTFALRPVDPAADTPLLHRWVTHPKSAFYLLQDATPQDVEREFTRIDAHPHHDAFLGLHDGEPAFLVERYDPAHVELAGLYPASEGDVGMHFLCAPTTTPRHGFTRAVITTVMELLFSDPATRRVVVEPDVRNTAVHALNAAVGFEVARRLAKPEKDAYLSTCTRAQYLATRTTTAPTVEEQPMTTTSLAAGDAVAHLTPERWDRANRLLVAKILAEFSHERLLAPREFADGRYSVTSDDKQVEYRFPARLLTLDHWHVDAAGITRHTDDGDELPLDALDLITELRITLGLAEEILPVYLEEISSTLAATAFKLSAPRPGAAELAHADFQAIETGMTEGHPCFVANNGRLGFDAAEYLAYAPEAAAGVQLIWLAARRDRSTFSVSADLDYDRLVRGELDAATLDRFEATMAGLGLSLADYHLVPVHPWQWWNKLAVTFAGDVARRHLVCLGPGDDTHLAQQSIRTFFNVGQPHRHYVKTALSVLNMGFMRGLSAEYMEATPAINDWLAGLVARDDVLRRTGLAVIRERAAVGYHPRQYEAATTKGSPYRKMLAALWRESPVPLLQPGEQLATMASLLHTDENGASLAAAFVARSGGDARTWLRHYLEAYLTPLLHCFYAYGLVFMPHGENVILVLEDGLPRRAVFKDIAEEIAVMDPDTELPPEAERIRAEVPDELQTLSLFTDVFDCFFRFLNAALSVEGVLSEDAFWSEVAACVLDYQRSMPHLAERFERFDLFAESFPLSCLNRLQLRDNRQMVDLQDPAGGLQFAGTLRNPIAGRNTAA